MAAKRNVRLFLGYVMGIIFLFRAKPSIASFVGGAAVVALGEIIRFVSAGTLKKYKGVVSRNGIYACTRNPLYIGSFILGSGFCIVGRDTVFFALFLFLFLVVYDKVIKREESYLQKQYGEEYEGYCREVPRIFPRKLDVVTIFKETSSAKSFNNKEGKTLLGILAVFIVMILKLNIQ